MGVFKIALLGHQGSDWNFLWPPWSYGIKVNVEMKNIEIGFEKVQFTPACFNANGVKNAKNAEKIKIFRFW